MSESTAARALSDTVPGSDNRRSRYVHQSAHKDGAARLELVTSPPGEPDSRVPANPPVPLPPPETAIQRLALYAFEAIEGTRSISQLAGTVTPEVVRELQARRSLRVERRTLIHDQRRIVALPGPAHTSRPHPEIVEAAVVLHARGRTSVVALRLERNAERWRATELTVL